MSFNFLSPVRREQALNTSFSSGEEGLVIRTTTVPLNRAVEMEFYEHHMGPVIQEADAVCDRIAEDLGLSPIDRERLDRLSTNDKAAFAADYAEYQRNITSVR